MYPYKYVRALTVACCIDAPPSLYPSSMSRRRTHRAYIHLISASESVCLCFCLSVCVCVRVCVCFLLPHEQLDCMFLYDNIGSRLLCFLCLLCRGCLHILKHLVCI